MEQKQENKVLELFKSQVGKQFGSPSPVGKYLNGTLVAVEEGKVIISYEVRAEFANPMGVMHGGIYALMLDDVLGATVFVLGNDFIFTTLNLNIDYLSAAKIGETITVHAHVIRAGKNIVHCEAKLFNNDNKLLAKATSNLAKTHIPAR